MMDGAPTKARTEKRRARGTRENRTTQQTNNPTTQATKTNQNPYSTAVHTVARPSLGILFLLFT
jgi:hypothetical protein